jgi:hypothetical protein
LVDFAVFRDGQEVLCEAKHGVPNSTLTHLFLDQVMPRLIAQLGRIVLHAGAVLAPEGAVAFLGESGSGKSTLVASLALSDFPVIADDNVVLERTGTDFIAVPSYLGLRLWPETARVLLSGGVPDRVTHYGQKLRVRPDHPGVKFSALAAPLRRVFVIEPQEVTEGAINIEAMSQRDAFVALMQSAFRLDVTDKHRLKSEFDGLSSLASLNLLWRIRIPRDLNLLGTLPTAIRQNLRVD